MQYGHMLFQRWWNCDMSNLDFAQRALFFAGEMASRLHMSTWMLPEILPKHHEQWTSELILQIPEHDHFSTERNGICKYDILGCVFC